MTYTGSNEYLAAKDAYFAQLIARVDSALAELDRGGKDKPAPKDSGDPAGGSSCVPEGPVALMSGALDANLADLPGDPTLFSCEIGHKQHPLCD